MRERGNFSPAELATLGNAGYESTSNVGAQFPGGIIPASRQFNGSWGQAMTNLLPLPNANPAVAQGYNYVNVSTKPQERLPTPAAYRLEHQRKHQAVRQL